MTKVQFKLSAKAVRIGGAVAFAGLLLTQFNNCGNYAEPMMSSESSSSLACTTDNCVTPVPENMKVIPHLPGGQYSVPLALSEFNIGGDCNEAGYTNNVLRWELRLNGTIVRTSSMPVAGGRAADSRCINGRFLLYVNLSSIAGDNVDRTGLRSGPSSRSTYDLYIELVGQSANGSATPPSVRTRVPLLAI